jgi:hypothetical protein
MAQQTQARSQPSERVGHLGPDPGAHASVLAEWFGVRTALEMARFYAKRFHGGVLVRRARQPGSALFAAGVNWE